MAMTLFEKIVAVVNIAALIIIPIAAVLILMMTRYNWTPESVRALNIIDVVFAKDKEVRNAWKACYEILCTPNINPQKIKMAEDKMLESMANALGYKDVITWETIQNPYNPYFRQ